MLLQKVLKDWFMLPERQEIFPGLILRLPTTPPLSFFGLPTPPTPHSDDVIYEQQNEINSWSEGWFKLKSYLTSAKGPISYRISRMSPKSFLIKKVSTNRR